MGRLEELRINAYLSEVARGYSNNAFVAQNLFPTIYSEKEQINIFEFNKEAFQIYDTERAIRANSNVIAPKGFKKHSATLAEHDLSYPIDYREEQEAEKVRLQLHATNVVTQGLQLKHEKACADLAQDVNSYATENKILLSGSSCFNHKDSDPQGVVDDAKDAVSKKIGQDPNTMIIGQDAWRALKRNASLRSLISNNTNKIITLEHLKEFFEVENIFIGKSIFTNEKGEFVRIWKDNIVLAYIEPFGGGAWVLFYKEKWAGLEIYNDLDGRLVNLFRIVKYHPNAFKEEFKYLLGSRELFFQFLNGTFITDIQRAVQFYFLITRSFGGRGDTFGTVKRSSGGACKSLKNVLAKIDVIHERLDKVMIENRDFEKLIKQYDCEEAFFYCDPPYSKGCGYAVTSTEDFAHERLRDVLKGIKGRFLLSYDDSPKIRELYKDFEMVEVERQNGINNRQGTDRANKIYKELLISNYPIKEIFKNGR